MSVALVVTTYERPDALAAVLASVARQRRPPDELIVADDGSGPATAEVIGQFQQSAPCAVRSVRQPHVGFRLARLRNLAINESRSDYLVFIDGDMVLHPDFIADHLRLARPGWFTQGIRAHAGDALTAALIADTGRKIGPGTPVSGLLRRAYLLRAPLLSRAVRRLANGFVAIKGCNQAFWRADLVRVNGFNEAFVGWGPEDKELCARLAHAGVRRQTLLFGGVAVHLHHPPAARDSFADNQAILADTRRERRAWCERGLSGHQAR